MQNLGMQAGIYGQQAGLAGQQFGAQQSSLNNLAALQQQQVTSSNLAQQQRFDALGAAGSNLSGLAGLSLQQQALQEGNRAAMEAENLRRLQVQNV